nr:unnamed protein product [Callosobruchus chinensis]
MGKAYVSSVTGKSVPARALKPRCNGELCKKTGKKCYLVSNENRQDIFDSYYSLANLTRQREFLCRHIEKYNTVRKTTKQEISRRSFSFRYYLTIGQKKILVCKTLFLSTLSISERTCRTALDKLTESGILEQEKRGGRHRTEDDLNRERLIKQKISEHIDLFPRVESHYCRSSTSKRYLHPDLTLRKMYFMFIQENEASGFEIKPSFSTYRRVFVTKNLSFSIRKRISVLYA